MQILLPHPFTDIWYKDCFYMALFQILNDEQRLKIINKEFYIYKTDYLPEIEVIKHSKEDISEMLESLGFSCGSRFEVDNLSSSLKCSIDNNSCVILAVDPFYTDLRKDAFNKVHLPHCLLVHGYCDNTFKIIEQQFRLSLNYRFETIDSEQLKNCYASFLDLMKDPAFINHKFPEECMSDNKYPTFFEISCHNNSYSNIKKEPISFDNIELIVLGIEKLRSRKEDLLSIYENGGDQELELLTDNINSIIIHKKIDLYRFKHIKKDTEILNNINKIVDNWSKLRTFFSKRLYSKKINFDHYKLINECFDQIVEYEFIIYNNIKEILYGQ